jgi:integrase/recombinase XerD
VTDLSALLQGFFTDRLARQKKASPHTVAAYRDTFRLLLTFAHQQTGAPPHQLSLADLDATLVGEFLQHLEQQGATPPPPATPGWPPSTRCSDTPPHGRPSTLS